jgi:hypothetical protein
VAAGGSRGPVQLHHLLGVGMQEPGQAGAIAAGAFNRPDTLARLLLGQGQQLAVAGRSGRRRCLGDHRPGGGGDDRGGGGLLVGVDADDELDEVCQHVHRVDSVPGVDVRGRPGPEPRQDCDGTRPTGIGRSGSYIRPAAPVWADAGSSERTSPRHDTTRVSHSKSHAHRHRYGPDHHRTMGSLTVIPPQVTLQRPRWWRRRHRPPDPHHQRVCLTTLICLAQAIWVSRRLVLSQIGAAAGTTTAAAARLPL